MNRIATFAVFTILISMTQVVGAGVVLLLGGYIDPQPDDGTPALIAWVIILAVAIWCAVAFLEGAILQARRFTKGPP
jgi:hypothetical protein